MQCEVMTDKQQFSWREVKVQKAGAVGSLTEKPSFSEMKETVLKSAEAPVREILNLHRIRTKS